MALTNKRFRYTIYDYTGNFITDWQDVVSDPSFTWEINNGPAELVVRLARPFANFGEGVDVAFENKLEVRVIDKEAPQGLLIYSGRLNEIRPHFGHDGEWVEVQFLGYASTLEDQVARDKSVVDFSMATYGITATVNTTLPYTASAANISTNVFASYFQPTVNNVSGIKVTLSGAVSNPQNVVAGLMYADVIPSGIAGNTQPPNPPFRPGNIIASGVINSGSIVGQFSTYTATFPNTIYNIDQTKPYFAFVVGSGITIQSALNSSKFPVNPLPTQPFIDVWGRTTLGGAENRADFWDFPIFQALNGNTAGLFENLNFQTTFETTAPLYVNSDPSAIAKDLVQNKYSGLVAWDNTSLATGLSVTYQFNRQTYLLALERLVELSPPYWYFIVKPDNTLKFQPRNDAVLDHILTLGQHITDASPIHSVNEIATRTVLYGGSDPGLPELVYTDDRPSMQTRYTLKEKIVRDSRVHKTSTASLFTRDYMDFYGGPSTQMQITVQDSNGDPRYGYDIEAFRPGQRVLVVDPRADGSKNFQGTADNINLDGDILDSFNNYILASPLQIMSIQYAPDSAVLTLANIPVVAPKKIDDISQNVLQTQTGNSPIL